MKCASCDAVAACTQYDIIGLSKGSTPDGAFPLRWRDSTHVVAQLVGSLDVLSWSSKGIQINEDKIERAIGNTRDGKEIVYNETRSYSGAVYGRECLPLKPIQIVSAFRAHFEKQTYVCVGANNCQASVDFLRWCRSQTEPPTVTVDGSVESTVTVVRPQEAEETSTS
jgi:hypothetical protein